jgi:hypothetical protein
MFLIEPEGEKLVDGSTFSHAIVSALRSAVTTKLDDHTDKTRLEAICRALRAGIAIGFTEVKCLYARLRHRTGGESSVWTKEHPQLYACRSCVNTQRLCMGIVQGMILVLPLHPLLRASDSDPEAADEGWMDGSIVDDGDAGVRPTEMGYWISAKRHLTRLIPYNKLDIWTDPREGR